LICSVSSYIYFPVFLFLFLFLALLPLTGVGGTSSEPRPNQQCPKFVENVPRGLDGWKHEKTWVHIALPLSLSQLVSHMGDNMFRLNVGFSSNRYLALLPVSLDHKRSGRRAFITWETSRLIHVRNVLNQEFMMRQQGG